MKKETKRELRERQARDAERQRKKVIEVQDVSMRFRLTDDKIMSLKEFVTRKLSGKLKTNEFWALKARQLRRVQGRGHGHHRPQRRRQEHHFEGDLRHSEAYRWQRDQPRQHRSHAGIGFRLCTWI